MQGSHVLRSAGAEIGRRKKEKMKANEFDCKWDKDAQKISYGRRALELKALLNDNPNTPLRLTVLLPESRAMRKFYQGAVLHLWAYLDGKNHKDWRVVKQYEKLAKIEYAGEIFITHGRTYKMPGSTRGKLDEITEKVICMLEEEYGIERMKVLDPEHYKDFRDRIYPAGEYDTYIEYLIALNRL
jgi:hypothetical protein